MIGFGQAEEVYEESIENSIREFVGEAYSRSDGYFTPETVQQVKTYIDKLGAEGRERADKHKTSLTYPDRYSYFWPTTISDASHIVFILRFHHVNRRHFASPDGWALMTSERLFYVYSGDLK